jgi:hypothetical protein
MPKIKAFLLVHDPSFVFYIHYPDVPFRKNVEGLEGNIGFSLIVPISDDFESEEKLCGFIDLARFWIHEAEKGMVGESDLEVECPLLVTLEQEIASEIADQYRAYNEYIGKAGERVGSKSGVEQIDMKPVTLNDKLPPLPAYHDEMFKVCRKYLKRFLLSLRERGNMCKLRFYDYNKPKDEFSSGLFGKYYFEFKLQDEAGNLLFDWYPLPLLAKGGGQERGFKVAKRLSNWESRKRDSNLISLKTWGHICEDLAREFEPDLARTFLLDAQDEVLSGNISMAIVCVAIACEIITDHFISGKASKIGNKFYDYIIEKVREICVVDLLDVPLESLVGCSIKERHRDLWNDLEKLFQTRNKIVHVGKCCYMSASGETQILVDHEKTMHFIERAYELFEILGGYDS